MAELTDAERSDLNFEYEHPASFDDLINCVERILTDRLAAERERIAQELADYLAAMDSAGGGIYTADFRDGFRHALAMLAAYQQPDTGGIRPEVREAARTALARRSEP